MQSIRDKDSSQLSICFPRFGALTLCCKRFDTRLLTCPKSEIRNGTEAIRLATQACQITKRQNTEMLDTLAAAYAEAGQFAEAVPTAQKAIALAQAAGQPDLAARLQAELKQYEAGLPIRQ